MVSRWFTVTRDFLTRVFDRAWARSHRLGLTLIGLAIGIIMIIGFMGPSSVALALGPRQSLLPPWYLPVGLVRMPDWVAVGSLWVAIAIGGLGLWIVLRAIRAGWRPHVRRLFVIGALTNVAVAAVPPMTSGDILMYAAYGRVQALGENPYTITPAEIFRERFDPVLRFTERPWQDTPSVYGPIASFSQWLANVLGGENMHDIVFWLQVISVATFIAVAAITVKLTHGEPATQARAVFLTVFNPLLIWAIVAGGHNESLAVVFAVAGLYFMRRSPFLAGVGIGLAGCVKVSLVFYGIAMMWGYRREPRKLALLLAGAAVPMVICYGLVAPGALFAASRNTGYISSGSWASWVLGWIWQPLGIGPASMIVSVLGYVGLVVVAWWLSQVLPWTAVAGLSPLDDPRKDSLTIAVRTALILSAAWLVTSPYTLSWYDIIVWVPLAMLAPSPLVGLFIWRGIALSIGYVHSRSVEIDPNVADIGNYLRDAISPTVQMSVVAIIGLWWWSERQSGRRRRRIRARLERLRRARAASGRTEST